jgi:predicted Zn-dependent protease
VPTRTPRMDQIEALLADDPADPFLRYGLALEHASAGDDATAADLLLRLIADQPYVPAFLMAGQILSRLNRVDEACAALRGGITAAREQGNAHAEGEMSGLLATIE